MLTAKVKLCQTVVVSGNVTTFYSLEVRAPWCNAPWFLIADFIAI